MDRLIRYKTAPTTVKEAKLNIFEPYEKKEAELIENIIVYEDNKYKVIINGYKLNQIHRDILDIALYFGDNSLDGKTNDMRPLRLFSLYDIQKHLNYKAKRNSRWVEEKFQEIKRTTINIEFKGENRDWIEFNIIDIAKYSEKQNKYAIVISELFMLFFENEISINYKPYLMQILKLNAQSRALVRYILSHSNSFRIDLDNAMQKIGISKKKITKQAFDYNRRRILQDKEKLEKLNIYLFKKSNDRRKQDYQIEYKILPDIQIFFPLQNTK